MKVINEEKREEAKTFVGNSNGWNFQIVRNLSNGHIWELFGDYCVVSNGYICLLRRRFEVVRIWNIFRC